MTDTGKYPITLEHMDAYCALYAASPVHAADVAFINVWGWAEHYGLEVDFDGALAWIRQNTLSESEAEILGPNAQQLPVYWSAVGPWHEADWKAPSPLDAGGLFTRVPEALALAWKEALGDRVELTEARGQWEYLYEAQALATLKGNKLHKKRNHVNSFFKSYEAEYHEISLDCVEDVLQMQQDWCQWRECMKSSSLVAENGVIRRVLSAWDELPGLMGGVLRVDKHIVAYTVAERLDDDTMVIHFEKACPEFRGAYQAINQRFAAAQADTVRHINREQDLDEPGLRQAKESYYPFDYVKKYQVTVLPRQA